ncbi:MAG: TIGR02680 family protein [Streptosporangiales bacterium]|nr:TIGR02680 family protein [Streptosporangiales bacterium]
MNRQLPTPVLERWQPLRAGLVDLFYYDSEEFWFRDGRLLLRGNNGTGKSKVLALVLPFLLDGDLAPHRVEPDADSRKRMEWNLLLGGDHPYPERLGYTWLEFGRVDEHGEAHYRTLGCGLKAVTGRGIARHWFFVTSRRPGADLALVDATRTALARDRLVDALAGHGTVYDRARDYRRAVDEALFGFGEQRYRALVDLLVQVRQPQLSKRPSEKALSAALTEALPPLDQAVIADVAEAFRSLEEDRDTLRAMTEAHHAATSFLGHYRRYARVASRRRAALPRNAQSDYERVNRDLGAAEAEYARADGELSAAKEKLTELAGVESRLKARDAALRASPEMRSARELERLGEDAQRLATEARRIAAERDDATGRVGDLEKRHNTATARRSSAGDKLTAARHSAGDAAATAHITDQHADGINTPLDAAHDLTALRGEAGRLVDRQQRAIDHVQSLLTKVDDTTRALADARRRATDLDTEAEDLAVRRTDAERTVTERGAALVREVRAHLDRATELRLPDPASTLAELELWVETLDGTNPATAAAGNAGRVAAAELATLAAELENRERAERERAAELAEEIARLERGEDTAPPPPHTRDATARQGRPGAPLWQLVDFAEHVDPVDRAGLEAALESAGILDAWMTPRGELLSADTDDVVVRAGTRADVALDTVLRPAVDRVAPQTSGMSDDTVAAVLGSIGLGRGGDTWVGVDGRYRIGVLEGTWHKPAAQYIGRGAREAARRSRLAKLRGTLTEVEAELTGITAARAQLKERETVLTAEQATFPGDQPVHQAHAAVGALAEERTRLTTRQEVAARELVAATAASEGARAAHLEGARDTGLPADTGELSDVRRGLGEYRIALAGLWPAAEGLDEATRHADQVAGDLGNARTARDELAMRTTETEHAAEAARETHDALRQTVGAAVAELERQLGEVADLVRDNENGRKRAQTEADGALEARGKAVGERERLGEQLVAVSAQRTTATESFRRFTNTGLLAVALPDLDIPDADETWAPDPTVRLARRVNDELADTPDDDSTWDRAQHRVNTELKTLHDTLSRHGNKAAADLRDDGIVVEVEFRGRPTSVPDLAEALAVEVDQRERLLDEREREILENHLVNEVASTLQELISVAESQVAAMNRELAERPTSTGMRLRLLWKPRDDGPSGLAAARERLLRQTADAWSADDRAAVGGFLQEQITQARSRDESGTWHEHLTEALDYRAWNRFVIQRHQNGQWRPATGPASGGERVLAASVPLFAAASAHYASADNPHAPRLITLDEAFAGVDDHARAKYLGLLAAFDLDVVMTSEREWGCYPEVPGLAISHLARREGVSAVLVTNWQWDGSDRLKVERPVSTLATEDRPEALSEGSWD